MAKTNSKFAKGNNRALTWEGIWYNLVEAEGELERLLARFQHLVFGEIADGEIKRWRSWVERVEEKLPLTGFGLFICLDHAYHHLNFGWNCRHVGEKRVGACAKADFVRWSRFPADAPFRDLQPVPARGRGVPRDLGVRPVCPTAVHAANLQLAVRELHRLRARVGDLLGGRYAPEDLARWSPPEGFPPLDEAEVARSLHRIYVELNALWATLQGRKEEVSRQTWLRRRRFPRVFVAAAAKRL